MPAPTQADAARLADALRQRFTSFEAHTDEVDTAPPPVRVIDCVLSLNRPYDTVVRPRVLDFARAHPRITTCADLLALIRSFPSPAAFMSSELRMNFPDRAATLVGVLEYLLQAQAGLPGASEPERLTEWARSAKPDGYRAIGVKGFGIAGFQYLRLLMGADTTKPDVHIIGFVRDAIGRPVTDVEALELLEAAAPILGVPLRALDGTIWRAAARGDATLKPPSAPPSSP